MKDLEIYLLSLLLAFLSVLPVAVLLLRNEWGKIKSVRVIHAAAFLSTDDLEQKIREIWWEAHFYGDAAADSVLVVTDSKQTKKLCRKLKKEFPSLKVNDEKKFMKALRANNGRQKKLYRA